MNYRQSQIKLRWITFTLVLFLKKKQATQNKGLAKWNSRLLCSCPLLPTQTGLLNPQLLRGSALLPLHQIDLVQGMGCCMFNFTRPAKRKRYFCSLLIVITRECLLIPWPEGVTWNQCCVQKNTLEAYIYRCLYQIIEKRNKLSSMKYCDNILMKHLVETPISDHAMRVCKMTQICLTKFW